MRFSGKTRKARETTRIFKEPLLDSVREFAKTIQLTLFALIARDMA